MGTKLTAGVIVTIAGVLGVNAYILWGGFGAWTAFVPAADDPIDAHTLDPSYEAVAGEALQLLIEHRTEQGFPSITAAVAHDGEIVWTAAVGWADVEQQIAADRNTLYRIGSTSKAVTATALGRLVDAGALDLDQPVIDYFPDVPQSWWGDLTLRALASHTAGFPDYATNQDLPGVYISQCGCVAYDSVTASLAMIDGNDTPRYEPGSDFFYSSYDINLVGAVMEQQQGKHYQTILRERVLEPLGLEATTTGLSGEDEDSAAFYDTREGEIRRWRPFDLSQRIPGGGIYASSADLVAIGSAWLDEDFLSAATRASMLTPQALTDGTINPQSYAVGWRHDADTPHPLDPSRTLARFHHGGVNKGAMSWLVVYPEAQLVVAVNINAVAPTFGDFAKVEKELTRLFLSVAERRQERLGP